jgi:transposase
MSKETLLNWQKQHFGENRSPMSAIHAVADFNNWRLYRRDIISSANGKLASDDISGFWGLTRSRLMKFRGLNRNTLYLHIKECEFRYNYRNENMQAKLMQMIHKQPLHEVQLLA